MPGLFDLSTLPQGAYPTLNPRKLTVLLQRNGTYSDVSSLVNQATILEKLTASNGFLFVLDQILRI
jgi:hypothetical protein